MRIPAILLKDGRIGEEEVAQEVGKRVEALKAFEFEPLLLISRRNVESVYWLLATIFAGRTVAFLSEEATPAERASAANTIGAKECLDTGSMRLGGTSLLLRSDLSPEFRLIVFTSGTSAAPKAVSLPMSALEASARAHSEHFSLSADDIWLGGISIVTRAMILGQNLAFSESSDAEDLLEWMRSGRISGASTVPTILYRLCVRKSGFAWHPSFRYLLVGGSGIPISLWDEICANFPAAPVFPSYGLTETASQILTASTKDPLSERREKLRALPGVRVDLDKGGELTVSGTMLADGYYREGRLFPRESERFSTGDLARATDTNAYFVTGRRDDLIISGGVNISPLEVEEVFRGLYPDLDCALVGIPDPEWGQIAVLMYSGPVGREALDHQLVLEAMRAKTSPKKIPKRICRVANLPRTGSGKILRRRLRE